MSEKLTALMEYIASAQASVIVSKDILLGELVFTVRPEALHGFIKFLKDDAKCAFRQLMDVCGADYPERPARFDVVYNLLSMPLNHRVRVKISVKDGALVDSVTDIHKAADWFEREVWDMYGIPFKSHPDLRRILTDYGFEGYPLRKDFPLTGYVELRYDETQKKVIYEPVHMSQEFRNFDFVSPWEGMTTVHLPGDEKAHKPKVMGDK